MKLFGTDGIRGRANEHPITAELFLRAGKSVATVLSSSGKRTRVLVGRDPRVSGEMLEAAVTSGLVSMGADVLAVGVLPTPAVAHLTRAMGCSAGVMITASHNPFEDNGLKIFGPDGYKLNDALESAIEDGILAKTSETTSVPADHIGRVHRIVDGSGRYIEMVKRSAGGVSLDGLKIVVDCGHGATHAIAPLIFGELGAEVIPMGTAPDGVNINDGVGALHPGQAAELVLRHSADLGVSFDGDGDRVIFTDAAGRVISGDKILGLCAIGLKEQGCLANDTLVATIMSNLGLHEAMKRRGIRVEATKVGDRHVIECMRAHGHSFGGENSGHLIFSEYSTTGDGIASALQILRMMRANEQTLAELAGFMDEYPSLLVNLPVKEKPPVDSLPQLQALMRDADAAFGTDGRHLIRYSGTENKIRVLVEHRDADTCREWVDRFSETIRREIG